MSESRTPRRKVARWTGYVSAFEGGGFVAYGDYLTLESDLAAAQARIAELEAERERLRKTITMLPVFVEHGCDFISRVDVIAALAAAEKEPT